MSHPDGQLVRAYRFALEPTSIQEEHLRSHCGAQRYAYNWGLRLVKANLEQRAAERSYGIAENELTPPLDWSAYALRRTWNEVKSNIAPWWRENSKESYSSGLANLSAALSNWVKSQSGDRRGPRMRFPRFKTRRSDLSCRFTTGTFGLAESDRRHVKLPRIGVVRTHESTRKLARRIAVGAARIMSATITFSRGRWFVSFSVEVRRARPAVSPSGAVVGVDLGIKNLAVLSTPVEGLTRADGIVPRSEHLGRAERALRRLQRQAARRRGPDKRIGNEPSRRWCKTQSKTNRLNAQIANRRIDALHKLTTALTCHFSVVVVEDLNVAGMLRNRRLARQISAASWGELRRQLAYKTDWRGGRLAVADRFYPSSKTCSACGAVKAKLRLSERVYHCETCGIAMDRDVNAARNLAALAGQVVSGASSPSCGATENEPAGNPHQSSRAGSGYRHGKSHEDNVA